MPSPEKILEMNDQEIVEKAIIYLNQNLPVNTGFNSDYYKKQVIREDGSVLVSFRMPVVYVPSNSIFYYEILVDLTNNTTYKYPIANPEELEYDGDIFFFKRDDSSDSAISFVIEAINQSTLVGHIEIEEMNPDDTLIVRDKEDHYAVSFVSANQESWYKIKKETGAVYDIGHAHLEPEN